MGPLRNGRTHSIAYGAGMILTIFTIHWHWMIPTQPGEDANLSKLLLMPMSMDGDIVCFTGYLDLLRFFAHGFEVSSKNLGQQHGISSNTVVSSQNLQGKSKLVVRKNTAHISFSYFTTLVVINYPTKWAILAA